MEIIKADFMGFCFGVKNAVDKTMKALEEEKNLYSLGEIIHNQDVIDFFEQKGLRVIDENDLKKFKDTNDNRKVLIRSHGVSKNVISFLELNNIKFIDATCPRVKNIHSIVDKFSSDGYEIIIIGDKNHPEVQGIMGWSSMPCHTAESIDEIIKLNLDSSKKYCLVCQTTFYHDIFKEIIEFLDKNEYTNIVRHNTICDATKKRQDACLKVVEQCDIMLVIGGKNSSNTKKLFELCKEKCKNTFLIENYKEIPYNYIDKKTKIGITAGASTPDWVIEEVIFYVKQSE